MSTIGGMRPVPWTKILPIAERLGASKEAMRKWEERGHVPFGWRLPIQEAARKARVKLAADDFGRQPAPRTKAA